MWCYPSSSELETNKSRSGRKKVKDVKGYSTGKVHVIGAAGDNGERSFYNKEIALLTRKSIQNNYTLANTTPVEVHVLGRCFISSITGSPAARLFIP